MQHLAHCWPLHFHRSMPPTKPWMIHRPVAQNGRYEECSRICISLVPRPLHTRTCRVGHNFCNLYEEFYVNIWALMHWYTCKSLLSTVGRAVEQLAGYFAKQAKSAVEVSTKICNSRAQGRGGWTHTLTDLHETPCHVWLVNIANQCGDGSWSAFLYPSCHAN